MGGRSIRIFLVDGTASGLRTADLGLSTIKAVVIPRASFASASKRPELARTGVYILVGPDESGTGAKKIYIGEGDTIITRLVAHNKDPERDFWTDAVALVSKDEALTKGHVRFLEAMLIRLAIEAKRSIVTNATSPAESGRLPEPDEVEMHEFIFQARILLGALGYDIFEPAASYPAANAKTNNPGDSERFLYSGDGFTATCDVSSEAGKFVVLANSTARKAEAGSLQATYKNLRASLASSGVLVVDGGSYTFAQDYAFGSASAAAAVVSGQTVSGRIAWKREKTGESFAEWEEGRLPSDQDLEQAARP